MTTKTKTEADDVCRVCKCNVTLVRFDDYPEDLTVPEMFDGLIDIGLGDTVCSKCTKGNNDE